MRKQSSGGSKGEGPFGRRTKSAKGRHGAKRRLEGGKRSFLPPRSRWGNERADESNAGASTGGTDGTGSPGFGGQGRLAASLRITQSDKLTRHTLPFTFYGRTAIIMDACVRGSGGIGRRVSLRSLWPKGREGSSPSFRTTGTIFERGSSPARLPFPPP